jgi:hypothetical protein
MNGPSDENVSIDKSIRRRIHMSRITSASQAHLPPNRPFGGGPMASTLRCFAIRELDCDSPGQCKCTSSV